MKKRFYVLIVTLLLFFISANVYSQTSNLKLDLMPYPQSVELHDGKFRLDENFQVQYSNIGNRLPKTANRFLDRLAKRTGLFLTNSFATKFTESIDATLFD